MATNQIPLYLDPGVGVRRYTGTDTLYHNLTDATGNVLDLQKNAASVLTIANEGMLTVGTVDSPSTTGPSLDVRGRPDIGYNPQPGSLVDNPILRLYDADVGENVLTVTKTELDGLSGAWAVNMVVRNSATPQLLDEALRITHDVRETTPTHSAAKLLSIGRTNDSAAAYVETFKFTQGGDLHVTNDVLWYSDDTGDIGTSTDYRPTNIYAKTSLVVAGSSLIENEVQLGQSPLVAGNRQVTAVIAGSNNPYLRWDNSAVAWKVFDGTTESNIGTSTVEDWDDLYAASKTLTLDSTALTWTQSDTTNYGFVIQKTVATAAQALMKVEATSGSFAAVPVLEVKRVNAGTALSLVGDLTVDGNLTFTEAFSSSTISNARELFVETTGSYRDLTLRATGTYADVQLSTAHYSSEIGLTSAGSINATTTGTGYITFVAGGNFNVTSGSEFEVNASGCDFNMGSGQCTFNHTGSIYKGFDIALDGAGASNYDAAGTNQIVVSASHFRLETQDASRDLYLGSARDIQFYARSSGFIAFNETGDLTPSTTSQSVIGAINELHSAVGDGTLDAAYNASAGPSTISVDAGDVTWSLATDSAYGFVVAAAEVTETADLLSSVGVSANLGTTGEEVALFKGEWTESDSLEIATIYGLKLRLTPGVLAANTKHAVDIDDSWDYGFYSASKALVGVTFDNTGTSFSSIASSNTLTSGEAITAVQAHAEGHADDAGDAVLCGVWADGTTTGPALKYGLYADKDWTYGLYTESPALVAVTDVVASTDLLMVAGNSDGLGATSKEVSLFKGEWTEYASAETATIYGLKLRMTPGGATNTKYAINVDADWDYGFYSASKALIGVSFDDTGSALYSIASSSGLTVGNEAIIALQAHVEGDALDHADAILCGVWADGTTTGPAKKYGLYVDKDWTYGLYTEAPALMSITDVTTGGVIVCETVGTSGGLTSGFSTFNGHLITMTGSASDTAGVINGIAISPFADNGGTLGSTRAISVGGGWDYSFYGQGPLLAGIASATSSVDLISAVGTSGGLGNTSQEVSIFKGEWTEDNSAEIATIYGLKLRINTDSLAANSTTHAINIDDGWDYSFNATSPAIISKTGNTGFTTSYANYGSSLNTIGASVLQTLSGYNATVLQSATDAGTLNGFRASCTANVSASGSTYGFITDGSWDYSFFSDNTGPVSFSNIATNGSANAAVHIGSSSSGLGFGQVNYALYIRPTGNAADNALSTLTGTLYECDAVGPASRTAISVSDDYDYSIGAQAAASILVTGAVATDYTINSSISSGGISTGSIASLVVTTNGHASDTSGGTLYGAQFLSNTLGTAIKSAMYVEGDWDYSLVADDAHVQVDMDLYAGTYSTSIGAINVETTTSSAISDTKRYGVKVVHSGNAGDGSSATVYNFHSSGDTTGAASKVGYYAGATSGNGLHYGFFSDNVGYAIHCNNGTAVIQTLSSVYAPTSATSALRHTSITSSGLTGGASWYGDSSIYTYSASDVSGYWYGYQAETKGTQVAGILAVGFKAQSNTDVGFMSYAPENRFQRLDDSSSTTSPTVLIENNDNDSTGGTAPALHVGNAYTANTGTCIEIEHGYSSTIAGSSRAIVFANAARNRRMVAQALWQPAHTTNTTADYMMYAPSTGTQAGWRTYSTLYYNKAIIIPLILPHNSILDRVYHYHQQTTTNSATESQRQYIEVFKRAYSTTVGTLLGTAYAPYTVGSANLACSLTSIAETVNNNSYEYYVKFSSGDNSHGFLAMKGCWYEYEITDFSAACGL